MPKERPADPTIEKICRVLCEINKVPENTIYQGNPMWRSFHTDALVLLAKLSEGDELPSGLVVSRKR